MSQSLKSYLKDNPIIKLYEGNLLYKKEKFDEAINNLESISFDFNKIKQEQLRVSTLGKCYDRSKHFDKAFFGCMSRSDALYGISNYQKKAILNKKDIYKIEILRN